MSDVHTPPVALLAYNAAFFRGFCCGIRQRDCDAYIGKLGARPPAEWATTTRNATRKSKRSVWPALSRVALRWAPVPMSSITAERVFGQARVVDAPQRQGQLWQTFRNEVFLTANRSILEELLAAHAK